MNPSTNLQIPHFNALDQMKRTPNLKKNVCTFFLFQLITSVFNRYTHESAIFNPLRSKRPIKFPDIDPDVYIEELNSQSEKDCDLCQYKE